MTTQLSLYNDALLICGERSLTALTEEVEGRRLLDQVWSSGGVDYCLESGQWFFAMRTVQVDFDPTVEPDFGYNRAFTKPDDWILTSALCADEFFRVPLTHYFDESGYWYSDIDTIYVRYVSNSTTYGMDLNKWPESFREFVTAHLASRICLKLSNSEEDKKVILELRKEYLKHAKSRCAMADSTMFPAQGSWSKARQRWISRRDGGNTSGSLIG